MTGKLTIVPTPIGNLGDITLRALDALREADVVCAEDTRVTGKLLAAIGVEGKRLERLDENVMAARAAAIIERVRAGEQVAYCSDAGMPGVSDPGMRLVAAAREADAQVEVLPGSSAAVTAYVASGTSASAFYFGGFFPRKEKARTDLLESLRVLDAALLFYESPKRLTRSLSAISVIFPDREVAVCRELTKLHEEIVRGPAHVVAAEFGARVAVKGEIVVVIDPPASNEGAADEKRVEERACELAEAGKSPRDVARHLAEEFNIPRNRAYEIALQT